MPYRPPTPAQLPSLPATSEKCRRQPRVYVGFETALQICCAISKHYRLSARSDKASIPSRVPSRSEIDSALTNVEALAPGLRIHGPRHVLVGGSAHLRPNDHSISHMRTTPYRGKSFIEIAQLRVATPELAFAQMATVLSYVKLLELGYEICGSYQVDRTSGRAEYQIMPLTSTQRIRAYLKRNPSIRGARKALRALRYVTDGSASPRETKLAITLLLPANDGGYGLNGLAMNHRVDCTPAAQEISCRSHLRCDLCWPDLKLDVEYQSRTEHEGERNRIRDSRRANALEAMGWRVVGITNEELNSYAATDAIALGLRRRMGKAAPRTPCYHMRKIMLRRELELPLSAAERYDLEHSTH